MSPVKHDPLCPLIKLSVLRTGCPQCELIRKGRLDGIRQALFVIDKGGRAEKQLIALMEAQP